MKIILGPNGEAPKPEAPPNVPDLARKAMADYASGSAASRTRAFENLVDGVMLLSGGLKQCFDQIRDLQGEIQQLKEARGKAE